MKDIKGSRKIHVVERLEAALFITNRRELTYLKPFLKQEATVSQAAAELGIGVTPMFKKLQRLLALGLVRETRQTARAGRATRHYRAIAEHFFVPFGLYPLESIGEYNRKHYLEVFEQNIQRLYRSPNFSGQNLGTFTDLTEAGESYLRITNAQGEPWDYLHPQSPALLSGWNPLRLNPEDAKNLQQDLANVLIKYLNKEGSHRYISGVFLTELLEPI